MSAPAFTEEQRTAIEQREGAFALAANAGSGKTSVLVERFVRDVAENAIAPGRILAITFTDRAAGELRARVRRELIARGERDAAQESTGAFISTFHGFCARVLRAHPLLAGLAPDFAVLDATQTAAFRDRGFQLALAEWMGQDGALDLAALFGVDWLQETVLATFDELRSRGEMTPRLPLPTLRGDIAAARAALDTARSLIARELGGAEAIPTVLDALEKLERAGELLQQSPHPHPAELSALRLGGAATVLKSPAAQAYETARAACESVIADELGAAAVSLLDGLLSGFGERFAALKRARGGVDFDDLELEAAALLARHEDVAQLWRERFERLMVDELQDSNARQMAILALLERDNLFTVGDEFQSIYAFRHADVEIFRERFATLYERQSARVLSANFRSRAPLLEAINAVFAPHFGAGFVPLRAGRTDAEDGAPIELLLSDGKGWEAYEELLGAELAPAPLWRRAEARLLAARIAELVAGGAVAPNEIVVLLRAASDIAVYESTIADLGFVTLAGAGEGFYARPEVVDLAVYVLALANPLDEIALFGALSSPLCGASSDALVALALRARDGEIPVWQALVGGTTEQPLASFAERFADARRAAPGSALADVLTRAVGDHGYDRYLCQLHSPERRVANVRKLIRLARDFERREGRDLRRFADALAAGRLGALHEPEAPPPIADAIRLMTIHSAKGLEFPVVCVADLGRGPNNTNPRLLTDSSRVGLRLPTLESTSVDTLDYAQLLEERKRAKSAEEQRIFYVAMTRAQERLILSGAARFDSWPGVESSAIAWLGPALVPDLPARAELGGRPAELIAGAAGVPVRLTLNTPDTLEAVLAPSPARVGDAIAAPVVADAHPPQPSAQASLAPLSYTALADYERCGYRYYLQHIIRLPDAEPAPGEAAQVGIGAAARGVLVHALLEQLDFAAAAPPDQLTIDAVALAAGISLSDDDDRRDIVALAEAFAHTSLAERLRRCSEVRREEPFAFALPAGELFRGFIDLAGIEQDGTMLIVDYKTDRLREGEDLAAHVERNYSLQRLVYALAGLEAGAPRVEVAYCFLRAPLEPVVASYLAAERPALEAQLDGRVRPLRAGSFEVTPAPGRDRCRTCPGRARLCSYDAAITGRGDAPPEPH